MTVGCVILICILSTPLFMCVLFATLRWSGVWRALAVVPACGLGYVVTRIVVDTSIDPASHNLWPIEIVLWSAVGLVGLALLVVARRLLHVQRQASSHPGPPNKA